VKHACAWVALAAAAFGAACGGSQDPAPEPIDPEEVHLEIGTGVDRFGPLANDAAIDLIAGPQGGGRYFGYHVWLALYARALDPNEMSVEWAVRAEGVEAPLATAAYRVDLEPVGDDLGAWGMRGILSDCCAAEMQRLELLLSVRDARGTMKEASLHVRAGECPRALPNPTIDPCP
jgi:hypothetical protein